MTNSQKFERAVIAAELRTSVVVLTVGRWSVRISQDNRVTIVFVDVPEHVTKIYKPRLCKGGVVRFPYTPDREIPEKILGKAAAILSRQRDIQDKLKEDFGHLDHFAQQIFNITIHGHEVGTVEEQLKTKNN